MPARPSLDELAQAVDAARPELDVGDVRVVRATYAALVRGTPASASDIAARAGVRVERVEDALASWPGIFRDEAGDVIGFWGLTIEDFGEHRMTVDGVTTSPWCAWDPLFIAPVLGREATVRSRCPVTGRDIWLTVTPDGVRDPSPSSVVVSFLSPDGKFDADVIQSFCHYVLFFADLQAGERWAAEHPGTFLLTLDEAFELGRLSNPAMQASASRHKLEHPSTLRRSGRLGRPASRP